MRPFAPLPHWLHGRSYVSHELRAYATPWLDSCRHLRGLPLAGYGSPFARADSVVGTKERVFLSLLRRRS
jgi:hypothetical protein